MKDKYDNYDNYTSFDWMREKLKTYGNGYDSMSGTVDNLSDIVYDLIGLLEYQEKYNQ